LEANSGSTSQEIPCLFMEPEGTLPSQQGTATGRYPEKYEFSPHNHTFSKIHFNTILQSTYKSPKWSLPFKVSEQNFLNEFRVHYIKV
jgi:hypothetical protein